MFVSARNQGRRRRSHVYGVNKAARSSKLSLLSAFTAASNGSGESTSTVTQDSYTKSKNEALKRKKHPRRRRTSESTRSCPLGSMEKEKEFKTPLDGDADVFTFLVKDGDTETEIEQVNISSLQCRLPTSHDSDNEPTPKNPHSDTGISMGDSDYHLTRSNSLPEPSLPPLMEDEGDDDDDDDDDEDDKPCSDKEKKDLQPKTSWKWPDIPTATHKHTSVLSSDLLSPIAEIEKLPAPSEEKKDPTLVHGDEKFNNPEGKVSQISGYDLVASMLAGSDGEPLSPVFRRFNRINYRVLLQLQDEIIEMEAELSQLDSIDSRVRHKSDGTTMPASRRLSWQWSQSDLQSHRLEVLGRLYIKLEQYYQALISAQKVRQLTSKAASKDIHTFRKFLQDRKPLSFPESRFLDDDADLLSLKDSDFLNKELDSTSYSLSMTIFVLFLLPLISFKVVFGLLNRLIVVSFIASTGVLLLQRLRIIQGKDGKEWIGLCVGVTGVAALLF